MYALLSYLSEHHVKQLPYSARAQHVSGAQVLESRHVLGAEEAVTQRWQPVTSGTAHFLQGDWTEHTDKLIG